MDVRIQQDSQDQRDGQDKTLKPSPAFILNIRHILTILFKGIRSDG